MNGVRTNSLLLVAFSVVVVLVALMGNAGASRGLNPVATTTENITVINETANSTITYTSSTYTTVSNTTTIFSTSYNITTIPVSIDSIRAVFIYTLAIAAVFVSYGVMLFRGRTYVSRRKEELTYRLEDIAQVGAVIGLISGCIFSLLYVFYLLGPTLENARIVIAAVLLTTILCAISLLTMRFEFSATLAHALLLLMFLPIVFDWLVLPTGQNIASGIFWELVQIFVVGVFVALFELIRKRKK